MCGRYALGVRLAFIRNQLQHHGQRVDEAPDDDQVRETYNFAPGNYGAIYRADTLDHGGYDPSEPHDGETQTTHHAEPKGVEESHDIGKEGTQDQIKYKLQSMKWGLVPFWTKRTPDYGSLMKTINCRDDSLAENKGMWTSMKKRKRCVVVCQGFYEWLKKGKEKIPHFVRRKDGDLMCFAGLWDCVQYEGSDEKLYTYTVITTSSNAALKFLHDRMPVILELGSAEMATWLDPHRNTWTKELQSMLKPYEGELEAYQVNKDVGKVGNNSPSFIIPIDSKENKKNIANFFVNTKKGGAQTQPKGEIEIRMEGKEAENATSRKRKYPPDEGDGVNPEKLPKIEDTPKPTTTTTTTTTTVSPVQSTISPSRKTRSATSNLTGTTKSKGAGTKTTGHRSQRITSFFKK
ncbi:hypothetical protein LOZ62_006532 [Ophidiomyces ophidiicola]|nr:hypothetical protein LOZ62_006532 [Ophidiomyces ophidiicola]KAI2179618.1 hypothetical protein LOZ21_005797 [Ophidiomyces ophidiicola]